MKRPEKKSDNILCESKKRNVEQTNKQTNISSSSSSLITNFFNYLQIVGVGVVLIVTCYSWCICFCICVHAYRTSTRTMYIIMGHSCEWHSYCIESYCRFNYSFYHLYKFIKFLLMQNRFWVRIFFAPIV